MRIFVWQLSVMVLGNGCVQFIQQKTLSFQVGPPAWASASSVFCFRSYLFITATTISKYGSDNLMHKMQGRIIWRSKSRSRGWVGKESQLCATQFAVFTEDAVVNFCSAILILYWMKEVIDILDVSLEAVWLWASRLPSLNPHCFFGE